VSAAGSGRRALRIIEVQVPAWADGVTRVREPRVRDMDAFMRTEGSELYRTAVLLGAMVLDDEGSPVGTDAIYDSGIAAIRGLEEAAADLTREAAGPLVQTSGSDTVSAPP
jgi:hypothetical protein